MTLTLGILAAGIIVVVGGVLVLRVHAVLAETLGALVVATLTPRTSVEQYALSRESLQFTVTSADSGRIRVSPSKTWTLLPGTTIFAYRFDDGVGEYATLTVESVDDDGNVFAIAQGEGVVIQPDDVLVTADASKAALDLGKQTIGKRVANGFGSTCGKIGILIAMASIIGKCLLDSGAADRIVRSTLRVLGERGAPFSFLSSGFLLGIPVFFDTVFYLMIPLGKAMRMRTGRNYLLYVLTIVAAVSYTHLTLPTIYSV